MASPLSFIFAAMAWLGMIVGGFVGLHTFETTPGTLGASSLRWPADSQLVRDPARPTLVMFVHPRCPCMHACLDELAQIMSRGQGHVSARVLVLRPSRFAEQWAHTSVWRSAQAIPGVEVLADVDGAEAARFGAETSGEVLLYNPAGVLQFRGGITWGRGMAGESIGRNAIVSIVNLGTADCHTTPVYGCALFDRGSNRGG